MYLFFFRLNWIKLCWHEKARYSVIIHIKINKNNNFFGLSANVTFPKTISNGKSGRTTSVLHDLTSAPTTSGCYFEFQISFLIFLTLLLDSYVQPTSLLLFMSCWTFAFFLCGGLTIFSVHWMSINWIRTWNVGVVHDKCFELQTFFLCGESPPAVYKK